MASASFTPGSATRKGGSQVGRRAGDLGRLLRPCSWWWNGLKNMIWSCAPFRRLLVNLMAGEHLAVVRHLWGAWLIAASAAAASPKIPEGSARGSAHCCQAG